VTTHCSNNYGPYQHEEKFIPTVIRACLLGKPIPVYGDGSHMRDWLYVADHCAAIDVVLRHGRVGDVYNIGGRSNWKNLDIVHEICHVLAALIGAPEEQFSHLIRFVKDRPGHDWRYAIDATKIHTELGWHPTETFITGIRKTVMWYSRKYKQ
jgi:dTDP-glucose 4,6-dehydratase